MQLILALASFILMVVCLCATPYYWYKKMKLLAFIYLIFAAMNLINFMYVFS